VVLNHKATDIIFAMSETRKIQQNSLSITKFIDCTEILMSVDLNCKLLSSFLFL
jgi:hypothetical protein